MNIGRFRFTIGFIDYIYQAIKLKKTKDVEELLDDWREEVVFARSNGSLFNYICNLHTRGYYSVFLTEEVLNFLLCLSSLEQPHQYPFITAGI